MKKSAISFAAFIGLTLAATAWAWDSDEAEELNEKAAEVIAEIKENDDGMNSYFEKSAAYVVFPTVDKGGMGIGGARGKGLLYENGAPTTIVTLTQLSIGFQFGGQAYSEFVFFEDDVACRISSAATMNLAHRLQLLRLPLVLLQTLTTTAA